MNEDCNHNDVPVPSISPPSDLRSPASTALPNSIATIEAALTVHVGQLPPPETVERYELVLPGAFDRILTMVEQAQQDKHGYNRTVLEQNGVELSIYGRSESAKSLFAQCGQVFGFVTVIIFFAILAYAMYLGNERMFGIILGAGALAGLVQLVRSFQNKGDNRR